MTQFDFSEKILELLQEKQYVPLQKYLETLNPADIAECMIDLLDGEDLDDKSLLRLFRLLPKELAADTFAEMDADLQEKLIAGFTDRELSEVLEEMFLDDTVDVIEEMPASVVKRILKNVDSDTRKSINQLLSYPEDSAGSLMTIEFVDLRPGMTGRTMRAGRCRLPVSINATSTMTAVRSRVMMRFRFRLSMHASFPLCFGMVR